MAHLVGKDVYRELGEKIDGLTARAPWNETFRALLEELYSEEDAELIVKMPYGLSRLKRLERVTGIPRPGSSGSSRACAIAAWCWTCASATPTTTRPCRW